MTPYIGIADCICDLVSSGATLEANNLIEFKSLMESEAVLISPVESKKITQTNIINLIKRFEGVINAKESKYVMLNVDRNSTEKNMQLLPGADSPTIIPLQKDNKVAIHALCKEPVFWETMEKLKLNGASSILVLPVENIKLMKILNRSNSNKEIQWLANSSLEKDLEKTVLRIKNLVLTKGSKAFDEINQELNLISPRSYKVKISEIMKSEMLVSDVLKESILNSAANIKTFL